MQVQLIVPRLSSTKSMVAIVHASITDGLSDQPQFTAALRPVVTDRIQQTSEGVRAWAHRHGTCGIGPLLAVLGAPALERCLALHGISHRTGEIVSRPDAAWRVDDVLGRI